MYYNKCVDRFSVISCYQNKSHENSAKKGKNYKTKSNERDEDDDDEEKPYFIRRMKDECLLTVFGTLKGDLLP